MTAKSLFVFLFLLLFIVLTVSCAGGNDTVATTEPNTLDTTAPVTVVFTEIFDESVTGKNHVTSLNAAKSSLYYYNKLYKQGPFAGDPYLFYDDGVFYLYGTTRKYVNPGKIVEEFEVYVSRDLVTWEDGGACFVPQKGDWCTVKMAERKLKVLTFKQSNMFSTLFKKMKILEDVK